MGATRQPLGGTARGARERAPSRYAAIPLVLTLTAIPVASDDAEKDAREERPAETPAAKTYKIQREKIYLGDSTEFSSPAVLEALRVYRTIPAYRKIADRKLTRDDPEYWPLMRHASSAFVRALKAVCAKRGYDLVGEAGSIEPETEPESEGEVEPVPEITDEVIEAIRADRVVRVARESAEGDEEAAGDGRELDELVNFPDL